MLLDRLIGEGDPDATKPFVDHLEDLRKTVLWSVGSLVSGMLLAIPLTPRILALSKVPLARAGVDPDTFLRVIRMTGGLSIAMRVALWGGLIFSLPFIVLIIGRFIFPGLTPREKGAIRRGGAFALLLFVGGVMLCYHVTLPVAVRMILRINGWLVIECNFVELGDYVSFVLRMVLAFGLAFELPVVLVALGMMGLVTSGQLREHRRHVIVGLLIAAMLLTPPDPLTQLLMALPLVLLYESCIWIIWARERTTREY